MGKRSPTKNVAGFPSCARNKIRWALWTVFRAALKLAVTLGMVARKIVFPPPNAINAGSAEPDAELTALLPKILCRV